MVQCPECNAVLRVPSDVVLYDRLYCDECDAFLEIVSLEPLTLERVADYEDLFISEEEPDEEHEWEEGEWEEDEWEEDWEKDWEEDWEDEEDWEED